MKLPARAAAAVVAVLASVFLVSCTAGDATPAPGAPAVVDQGPTVELTIGRALFDLDDALTDDELVAAAADRGFDARIDGDSVILTITEAQRDEYLANLRASAQEAGEGLIADTTNSITGIEYNADMTRFRIAVDGARYAEYEALVVVAFYFQGALYQQFSGVQEDDVDVIVELVDDATGELLSSGSYRELRATQ